MWYRGVNWNHPLTNKEFFIPSVFSVDYLYWQQSSFSKDMSLLRLSLFYLDNELIKKIMCVHHDLQEVV